MPDGNCMFDAVAEQMQQLGIHRSAHTLRHEVVTVLRGNDSNALTRHLPGFVSGSWQSYVDSMGRDGTYGDHIVLSIMSWLYNEQFLIFSSLEMWTTWRL